MLRNRDDATGADADAGTGTGTGAGCAFVLFFFFSFACDCSLCLDSLSYSLAVPLCALFSSSDTHLRFSFIFFPVRSFAGWLVGSVCMCSAFSVHNLEQSAWSLCSDVLIFWHAS